MKAFSSEKILPPKGAEHCKPLLSTLLTRSFVLFTLLWSKDLAVTMPRLMTNQTSLSVVWDGAGFRFEWKNGVKDLFYTEESPILEKMIACHYFAYKTRRFEQVLRKFFTSGCSVFLSTHMVNRWNVWKIFIVWSQRRMRVATATTSLCCWLCGTLCFLR